LTVPTSAPTASAISASVSPSYSARITTSRWSGQCPHRPADDLADLAAFDVNGVRDKHTRVRAPGLRGLLRLRGPRLRDPRLRDPRLRDFVERLESMFCPPVLEREIPGDPQQESAQRPADRVESVRMA
jgi:hypothetical protein